MIESLLRAISRRPWPRPSLDHLLRAALLQDHEAAATAWREYEAMADFDHLAAIEMRLLGLVAQRIGTFAPDSPMRGRIGGIERANWTRSQLAIGEAGSGLRALAAEVSVLAVKEAVRVAQCNGTMRGHLLNRVDIVLRPEDRETAFDLLTRDGWRPVGPGTTQYQRDRLSGFPSLEFTRGQFGSIVLHRTAFSRAYAAAAEDAPIWQRSLDGRLGKVAVRLPSATDAMAMALAGNMRDADESGGRLIDVAAAIDDGVDWDLFQDIADRRRMHAPAAAGLRYVHEQLERQVPSSVLERTERRAIRRPLALVATNSNLHRDVLRHWHAVRRKTRYRLSWFLASLARLVGVCVPGWGMPRRVAERLSFVRSVYGPYLFNTPNDRTFELCVEGYGPFVAEAIRNQNRPFVFLDIGANLGLFSLVADANPNCARAIAIEPLPRIFRNLQANIRRNQAGKVEPVLGAITSAAGPTVSLIFNPRHSGMSKVAREQGGSVSAPAISAVGLDHMFAESPDVVVAKIDVEGAEIDVLSTLRASRIYAAIEEIIIEVSEVNLGAGEREQLLEMLERDGFEELSRSGSARHYDAHYRRNGTGRSRPQKP